MSNPANQAGAARQARAMLARTLPGARRGSVASHLARAEGIASRIWRRWQVGPYRWRVKHLRWYLTHVSQTLSPTTRYRHWLTVRVLIQCLGREDDWLPRLQGPWVRPSGERGVLKVGRPALRPSRIGHLTGVR